MLATHVAAAVLSHVHVAATWVVQEGGGAMATDPLGLWKAMGWVAKTVVIILFIMSGKHGQILDRGEVLLHPGDVVVQQGTNHSHQTIEDAVMGYVVKRAGGKGSP